MNNNKLQEFLIQEIEKLKKAKGKHNATIDKNIDDVIKDWTLSLKKAIKINDGLKIK
jgi:hypothetical protein|tara:strand:- start:41 stop:211 length:171 start_codon:yes stop_codon:yes gene_type:complete